MKLSPRNAILIAFFLAVGSEFSFGGSTISFQRPDVSVGKVKNETAVRVGDDIYNKTGAGQTLRLVGRSGQKMVFFFCVMNDGTDDEQYFFKGTRRNRQFNITYKEIGGRNISAEVFRGVYTGYLANPGDGVYIKTIAKPTRRFRDRRAKIIIGGEVTSDFDPHVIDFARAVFVNRP